jgi:hypothetical protein
MVVVLSMTNAWNCGMSRILETDGVTDSGKQGAGKAGVTAGWERTINAVGNGRQRLFLLPRLELVVAVTAGN